jgi:hypothetical protein
MCVALAGFGSNDWLLFVLVRLTRSFGDGRLKVHGARSGLPASAFGKFARGPICIGIPRHLTIRSSRPHVVASATCYALRLHVSAAPPRVGLTQALGGRKAF